MFWYEIRTVPGYRISHIGEVLSLKGDEPRVMKIWNNRVTLRQDGRSVTYSIPQLMALADISVPPPEHPHPEAMRKTCDQGHEFTAANTMRRGGKNGDIRKCKRCHRDAVARWRAKKARPPTSPGDR